MIDLAARREFITLLGGATTWPLAAQDLVLGWWSIGSGGLGFNEQIFGADKQVPGRGQSD
jgi:hypothetical protein